MKLTCLFRINYICHLLSFNAAFPLLIKKQRVLAYLSASLGKFWSFGVQG